MTLTTRQYNRAVREGREDALNDIANNQIFRKGHEWLACAAMALVENARISMDQQIAWGDVFATSYEQTITEQEGKSNGKEGREEA